MDQNNLKPAGDDHIIPYHVDGLEIRGRAIQLGPMLNSILGGHQYPKPVSRLLAQAIVLNVLLGSSLKFEGRFIVQTQSDGPVSFMIVDLTTPDQVRAYARFDNDRLAHLNSQELLDSTCLLGDGAMAITIEQGGHAERYQGIVALDGLNLEEAADQYFRQSEQIPTKLKIGVAELIEKKSTSGSGSSWRAGGLIAQFLPASPERIKINDISGGDETIIIDDDHDDAWVEALALVNTISDDELTDPQIGSERLLFRLFHQRGVHVHTSSQLRHQCKCSKEKIVAILNRFSAEERAQALSASPNDDAITSKCEFCGTGYAVSMSEIEPVK